MVSSITQTKPKMTLLLASPRGFCAGVARAVNIVEAALAKWGAPIFVRHQIVHNQAVVSRLAKLGAVFVESLDEVPDDVSNKLSDGGHRVIFSAHGVPPSIIAEAKARGFFVLDATCPLVSKVHAEVKRHQAQGRHVFLIGHRTHPEIIGTIGHLKKDGWSLIETIDDAKKHQPSCQCKDYRLCHANHTFGERNGRYYCCAKESLSYDCHAKRRGHLLRHDQPTASRKGACPFLR